MMPEPKGYSLPMIALPGIAVRCFVCLLVCAASARAEDGYDLWLRYRPIEGSWAIRYRSFSTEVVSAPGANFAAQELLRGMTGLLAVTPTVGRRITREGAIVLAAPGSSSVGLGASAADLKTLGSEGYLIRSIRVHGHRATLIAAIHGAHRDRRPAQRRPTRCRCACLVAA